MVTRLGIIKFISTSLLHRDLNNGNVIFNASTARVENTNKFALKYVPVRVFFFNTFFTAVALFSWFSFFSTTVDFLNFFIGTTSSSSLS
jgi:hypothetical protein